MSNDALIFFLFVLFGILALCGLVVFAVLKQIRRQILTLEKERAFLMAKADVLEDEIGKQSEQIADLAVDVQELQETVNEQESKIRVVAIASAVTGIANAIGLAASAKK